MKRLILVGFLITVAGCVTPGGPAEKLPPKISTEMTLDSALQAGIDFGGETARDVRKLVSTRKQWPIAEKLLYQAIQDGIIKYENSQLVNAVMLYVSGPVTPQEALFFQMVSSGRPLARQLAWQMAAALPGKVMRSAIEREINRALVEGDEENILIPPMAGAAQANRLGQAYSILRQGLMSTNHEDFAQAMAVLNPSAASADFLTYLSMCPPEELRQLTVNSINIFAATVALNHFLKYPPSVTHAQIEVLFYYAISRNPGLSDVASVVVDDMSQKNQGGMALTLSRMPTWVQVAYIEGARRSLTTSKRLFLSELKKLTAQSDVVEELGDVKL